jgi:predicted RNase H-like HicB family nuclease
MATQLQENLNIYWSDEDNCYICTSNLYPDIIGIGDSEKEARQVYYELLEDYLKEHKPGKNKGGRPKKANAKLTYNVSVEVKAFIELEALREDINQGAVIEKIVNFYKEANKKELSKHYS